VYLWSLHANNDGLWFQGDAPRHAANGLFWIDYLRDFTFDARSYALSYYARYPVIDPASRPPVFYLLEGLAFTLLGPSPYVAKGLVLCFTLVAAFYLLAWLRRWVAAEAGWAAGLFLLLPGVVRWSHAVMLNVPALALGVGALYHARRRMEEPTAGRRHLVLALTLALAGILTYYPTGVVLLVMAGWAAMDGTRLGRVGRRTWIFVALAMAVLVPFAWLISYWAPVQLGWVLPTGTTLGSFVTWTYYPQNLPSLSGLLVLWLAGVGIVAGVVQRRWRREVAVLTSWMAVLYVVFALLYAKDPRYALPALVPITILSIIGITSLSEWLFRRASIATSQRLLVAVASGILLVQTGLAARYPVESVSGFRELVSFVERVAPAEPVFYDGYHDGVFTFYLRAGDEGFRRRVVLGNKLLYAFAMVPGWRQQDFVDSPEEVIQVLQDRGGARWMAIERGPRDRVVPPMAHLRDAVESPAFELVRSFPVDGLLVDRVDLYRFTLPIAEVSEVELPFPGLGPNVKYRVRPISPR
jgi:hypothetical protein